MRLRLTATQIEYEARPLGEESCRVFQRMTLAWCALGKESAHDVSVVRYLARIRDTNCQLRATTEVFQGARNFSGLCEQPHVCFAFSAQECTFVRWRHIATARISFCVTRWPFLNQFYDH